MKRRKFISKATILPLFAFARPSLAYWFKSDIKKAPFRRVRPSDSAWPSAEKWHKLKTAVNGQLIKLESPFTNGCKVNGKSDTCDQLFKELKNPYYIGDQPALTQTSGWLDAWTSRPSTYAVSAKNSADIAAAVNFARENNLRLVVKGGGHSYQGTSNSPDSLLIWTRQMNKIEIHDNFLPMGASGQLTPQPAVTIESGAIWMHVYNEVMTKAGKYVQGGGCGTVGVAGLIQSGGFGSFSKNYGLAAAALLQAEIVTADGAILIVNDQNHPDLFWGLKGGGGGSLGVVTKVTLRLRELPDFLGVASGIIKANSDMAFKKLVDKIMSFYRDELFNPHWGEQLRFHSGNVLRISMMFHGLTKDQATEIWRPFQEWIAGSAQDFTWMSPLTIAAVPAQHLWDPEFLRKYAPGQIAADDRNGAPQENIFWAGDKDECGQFLHSYKSAWLPANLLAKENQQELADAIFNASRYWTVSLHFNKGLAGSHKEEIESAGNTAMNPLVLNAFALAIVAGGSEPAFPGISNHEPDMVNAREDANNINLSMNALLKVVPVHGSYVSESDFFEKNWQQSFWGANYHKLKAVKRKYDAGGLFFGHHGVGSEDWTDDGFTKL
jgi:hypothetical protein